MIMLEPMYLCEPFTIDENSSTPWTRVNHKHLVFGFLSLSLYIFILTSDRSKGHKLDTLRCSKVFTDFVHQHLAPYVGTTFILTLTSFVKLVSIVRTLSFDQESLSNMGREGSHAERYPYHA